MFGNQIAVLSLLLVGLSLSNFCNLSEAAHTYDELLEMLLQATDINDIHPIFVELGSSFQDYAALANINEEDCTPARILFDNRAGHLLGQTAQQYVTIMVERQRDICEQTFVNRLTTQFAIYNQDSSWRVYFDEFIGFVRPWPTIATQRHQIRDIIKDSIFNYYHWRQTEGTGTKNIVKIRRTLVQNSRDVYRFFSGFLASFNTGRHFAPFLDITNFYAITLGKVAEAVLFALS